MKKLSLKIFTLTTVLCISAASSGCTANAAAAKKADKQTAASSTTLEQAHNSGDTFSSNPASTAEAYESDKVVSPEEQAKAEESRRSEIKEQYSIYEPYGMGYDTDKERFFYNGQMVRYFKDQVSADSINSFFFEDGIIDVQPIRDTNGTLTGLKQSSDADFKARTEKQKEIKSEFDAAALSINSGSFELGDPNYHDDSLEDYTAFGVYYDQDTKKWIYDGKVIRFLYDDGFNIYCDYGVNDGIGIKVIRDENGSIKNLAETEAEKLEQYIK